MKDIYELKNYLEDKLDEIRKKENKTLNDREEYKKIQEQLRELYKVAIWITRFKEGTRIS